jgi:hypothetical protein
VAEFVRILFMLFSIFVIGVMVVAAIDIVIRRGRR